MSLLTPVGTTNVPYTHGVAKTAVADAIEVADGVDVEVALTEMVTDAEPVIDPVIDAVAVLEGVVVSDAVNEAVALLDRVGVAVSVCVGVCVGDAVSDAVNDAVALADRVAVPVDEPELVIDELTVADGVVERLGETLEVAERERLAVAVVDAVADAEHDTPGATMAANVGRENSLCAYA